MHQETKELLSHFTAIFALLLWSGTKPTISRRDACNILQKKITCLENTGTKARTYYMHRWEVCIMIQQAQLSLKLYPILCHSME